MTSTIARGWLASLVCFAGWTSALPAQRTWIVDPDGRPGTDFTTLLPAVAASAPGDTILIRASSRTLDVSVSTNKGITIVGESLIRAQGLLQVRGLPADQRFVVRNIGAGLMGIVDVWVYSCRGSVHVQDVVAYPQFGATMDLSVFDSHRVTARRCVGRQIRVAASVVLLTECTFSGNVDQYPYRDRRPAAWISDSEVVAVDTQLIGGQGVLLLPCEQSVHNQFGVSLARSRLELVGASTVRGGDTPNNSVCYWLTPQPSVVGDGTVSVDQGSILRPPAAATVAVSYTVRQVTRSSTAAAGTALTVDVTAVGGSLAATYASLPGSAAAMLFSRLWLDLGTATLTDLTVIDTSGRRSFTIPSITVPDGVPLVFQTALLHQGAVWLTVPGITVLGR